MHTSLQLQYLRIMIDVNCFKTWLVLLIETERFNNLTRTYMYNGPRYMISLMYRVIKQIDLIVGGNK